MWAHVEQKFPLAAPAGVDSKAREFGGAVVDGYKAREAELRAAVAEAEDAIADLSKRIK